MDALGLDFDVNSRGEALLNDSVAGETLSELRESLAPYGIEILIDEKTRLVEQIKDRLELFVYNEVEVSNQNISSYLSEELGFSYNYISRIFTEYTKMSVESYVILRKLDVVKDMLLRENKSLTEIAHVLDYSSVAYLSAQFKKHTGMTPTKFRELTLRRESQFG